MLSVIVCILRVPTGIYYSNSIYAYDYIDTTGA